MLLAIKLFDRDKVELNFGDIVAISDGKQLKFYAEVTWMEAERKISPFHTFSFHSVKKVDKVPDGAELCSEDRFRCWYMPNPENDEHKAQIENYLMDWRHCERVLDDTMFEVMPITVHAEVCKNCGGDGYDPYPNHSTTQSPCLHCLGSGIAKTTTTAAA